MQWPLFSIRIKTDRILLDAMMNVLRYVSFCLFVGMCVQSTTNVACVEMCIKKKRFKLVSIK